MFDAHTHQGQHSRILALALLTFLITALIFTGGGAPGAVRSAPAVAGGPQESIGGCTLSFTDLPTSDPFYGFVQTLVCRSIVGGYSDNTFRPGANVTRGQLAKFVSNAAGYQDAIPATQQTFRDVPPDNPFWMFIERVHAHNVVGGYADGSFQPGNNVTRGQIAKFVSNAAVLTDTIPATQQTFADVPAANPFWLYIERAAKAGVVGGYADGTFRPTNNVTRGQTAKFIANGFFPAGAQQLIAAAYRAGTDRLPDLAALPRLRAVRRHPATGDVSGYRFHRRCDLVPRDRGEPGDLAGERAGAVAAVPGAPGQPGQHLEYPRRQGHAIRAGDGPRPGLQQHRLGQSGERQPAAPRQGLGALQPPGRRRLRCGDQHHPGHPRSGVGSDDRRDGRAARRRVWRRECCHRFLRRGAARPGVSQSGRLVADRRQGRRRSDAADLRDGRPQQRLCAAVAGESGRAALPLAGGP